VGGTVSLFIETSVGAGLGETFGSGTPVTASSLLDSRILLPLVGFTVLTILPLIVKTVRARLRRDN
jgi:hypothetical protein